jgi:hypothetical protein
MHKTYAFLISVPKFYSLKGRAEHAAKVFERDYGSSDYIDQNNWYKIYGIISECGQSFNLIDDEEDFRGRDSVISAFINSSPEKTWNGLIDFSYEAIRCDLTLQFPLGFSSHGAIYGDHLPRCRKDLASFLDTHKKEIEENQLPLPFPYKKEEKDEYISRITFIGDCIRSSRFGLFSRTMATPYDYRCFDLRDDCDIRDASTGNCENVTLLVDIHT